MPILGLRESEYQALGLRMQHLSLNNNSCINTNTGSSNRPIMAVNPQRAARRSSERNLSRRRVSDSNRNRREVNERQYEQRRPSSRPFNPERSRRDSSRRASSSTRRRSARRGSPSAGGDGGYPYLRVGGMPQRKRSASIASSLGRTSERSRSRGSSVDGGRRSVDGGRRSVDGSRRSVDGGRRSVVDGDRRSVDGGRRRRASSSSGGSRRGTVSVGASSSFESDSVNARLKNLSYRLRRRYGGRIDALVQRYVEISVQSARFANNFNYLRRCRESGLVSWEYWVSNPLVKNTREVVRLLDRCSFELMTIDQDYFRVRRTQVGQQLALLEARISQQLSGSDFEELTEVVRAYREVVFSDIRGRQRKAFLDLRKENDKFRQDLLAVKAIRQNKPKKQQQLQEQQQQDQKQQDQQLQQENQHEQEQEQVSEESPSGDTGVCSKTPSPADEKNATFLIEQQDDSGAESAGVDGVEKKEEADTTETAHVEFAKPRKQQRPPRAKAGDRRVSPMRHVVSRRRVGSASSENDTTSEKSLVE